MKYLVSDFDSGKKVKLCKSEKEAQTACYWYQWSGKRTASIKIITEEG